MRFASCWGWFLRVLAATALASALAACVSVRVPSLPNADLPAHWRHAPPSGSKPDLTHWWQHFHDPALNALVARALKDNPDVAQAVWKLRAARSLEQATKAKHRPQLAFGSTETANAANTASYFQAGFDATWEIGLFGRRGANGHIAAEDAAAAQADLASARVSLVAEVVREYLKLRAAQREITLLQNAAQAAAKRLHLLKVRVHLELASQRDVVKAQAAVSNARARLADPRAALAGSAQSLAVLMDQTEPDSAWFKPAPLPRLEVGNVGLLPADLLRTRPDIRQAQSRVLKAAGELGVAKANLYPHLALRGGWSLARRVEGRGLLGVGLTNDIFGIGPVIRIPLFNWGQLKATRNARADLLKAALAAYRKAVLNGVAQVESDLARLEAAGQRVQHAATATAASQQALDLDKKLLALEQADQMTLAAARLDLCQDQLTQVKARLKHALAFVALYKALGGAPLPAGPIGARATAPPGGRMR